MNNIAEQICEAVDIIVSQKIAKAGYDRTIQATVLSCEDSIMGKYRVKFQNSSFIAYAANPSIRYQKDSLVYILIPGNDMSKDKIIMNSVDKNIYDYTNTIEDDNRFQTIGGNVILTEKEIGLCSYLGSDSEIMYAFTEGVESEEVDDELLIPAIQEGGYLRAKITIQTALDITQQSKGQYGLSFTFKYVNGTTSTVTFTSNQMSGNPYTFTAKQEQIAYIPINNANDLTGIVEIKAFSLNFPTGNSDTDDIFLSNLELSGAKLLTKEELSSIVLNLTSAQEQYKSKYFIGEVRNPTIEIKASFLINGNSSTKEFTCSWYKENLLISANHNDYDGLAGVGWELVSETSSSISDGQAYSIYSFNYTNLTANKNRYKCIAQFSGENELYSAEITITNTNRDKVNQTVTITSSQGTSFYNGQSAEMPILTPKCADADDGTYQYTWKALLNEGIEVYFYNTQDIDDSGVFIRWVNNGAVEVNVSKILNSTTYYCYVYDAKGNFYGSSSIALTNTVDSTSAYFDIQVENGNQVYIYNKHGLSPVHESLDNKQNIPNLHFSFVNESGNIIPYNHIIQEGGSVKWKIPIYNTMIKTAATTSEDNYYIVEEEFLSYSIVDRFDINKNNNTIILEVIYQDITTIKEIELTFLKDNDNENNGTDTEFKLVSNYGGNVLLSYYYANGANSLFYKTTPSSIFCNSGKIVAGEHLSLFTPQLWKNGILITESNYEYDWLNLKINDNNSFADSSIFEKSSNGNLQITSARAEKEGWLFNHILRAVATYKDKKYFTEMPIITINMHTEECQIALKPGTGFQKVKYDKNGKNPSYDNLYPFEILVGIENEIQPSSNYTYNWEILGDEEYFYILSQEDNKCFIAPLDTFIGDCFNAAVQVKVSQNGTEIGNIHIPIYLYLDREDAESLDGWDGNFIINEDERILTPTGYGALDNALFSGILFGQIKKDDSLDQGLFLYQGGKRLLEATAAGYITLDSQGKGIITASMNGIQLESMTDSTNNGFVINLATAEIKYFNNNFAIDKSGTIQALTLAKTVQIDGINIKDEISDNSTGLGKILSNYVLNTTYEAKVKNIEDTIQGVKNTHTSFVNNTYNPAIQSINQSLESHAQTLTKHSAAIDKLEDDVNLINQSYVTQNQMETIFGIPGTESLDGYTLADTLKDYVTTTTLTDTLKEYVTSTSLTNTLKDYITITKFETLLNPSESDSIAPIISGGEITIETFIVDSTGEVAAESATITNLVSSNYKWENAEDAEDTLDLIEEIKALKEEVAALKEQLEGTTPTE